MKKEIKSVIRKYATGELSAAAAMKQVKEITEAYVTEAEAIQMMQKVFKEGKQPLNVEPFRTNPNYLAMNNLRVARAAGRSSRPETYVNTLKKCGVSRSPVAEVLFRL